MTLDFIKFIGDNSKSLTAIQKTAMLIDFCENFDYQETVRDENGIIIPNPKIKKEFANDVIQDFIVASVRKVRRQRAENALQIDELIIG